MSGTIAASTSRDMSELVFDLAAALGDDFRALASMQITAWRLYPYTIDAFADGYGYSTNYPFYKDTQIVFGQMILAGGGGGISVSLR